MNMMASYYEGAILCTNRRSIGTDVELDIQFHGHEMAAVRT